MKECRPGAPPLGLLHSKALSCCRVVAQEEVQQLFSGKRIKQQCVKDCQDLVTRMYRTCQTGVAKCWNHDIAGITKKVKKLGADLALTQKQTALAVAVAVAVLAVAVSVRSGVWHEGPGNRNAPHTHTTFFRQAAGRQQAGGRQGGEGLRVQRAMPRGAGCKPGTKTVAGEPTLDELIGKKGLHRTIFHMFG